MGERFKIAFPSRTDFQSALLIFEVFIIALFVSEILTVFIDLPSVDLSRWIEKKVLKDPNWTFKDIAYSVPYWPYNIIYFFYSKSLICFCNFSWVITCSYNNILIIWKLMLALFVRRNNEKNNRKLDKNSTDTALLMSPEYDNLVACECNQES